MPICLFPFRYENNIHDTDQTYLDNMNYNQMAVMVRDKYLESKHLTREMKDYVSMLLIYWPLAIAATSTDGSNHPAKIAAQKDILH